MNTVTNGLGHCHVILLTTMRLYTQSHTQTTVVAALAAVVSMMLAITGAAKESKMKYCELLNQKEINKKHSTTTFHAQCTRNENWFSVYAFTFWCEEMQFNCTMYADTLAAPQR